MTAVGSGTNRLCRCSRHHFYKAYTFAKASLNICFRRHFTASLVEARFYVFQIALLETCLQNCDLPSDQTKPKLWNVDITL